MLPVFVINARRGCSSLFEAAQGISFVSVANPNPLAFPQNGGTAVIDSLCPQTVQLHRDKDRLNVLFWRKVENRSVKFDSKSTVDEQLRRKLQVSSAEEL